MTTPVTSTDRVMSVVGRKTGCRAWPSRYGIFLAVMLMIVNVLHAAPRSRPSRSSSSALTILRVDGIEFVDAAEFARGFGLKLTWLKPAERLTLKSATWDIDLEVDSREAQINGLRVLVNVPPRLQRRSMLISRVDAEKLFAPILRPGYGQPAVPFVKVIVIDAGHGGKDPGKENHTLKINEKTMALDVAQRLKKLLEAKGYKIVMTRNNDSYPELEERTDIARQAGADLFISIHFNAFSNPMIKGTETFVMTPQHFASTDPEKDKSMIPTAYPNNKLDTWNALLGFSVHNGLMKSLKSEDRGMRRARFVVLRTADCPAVLIESAYLSNDGEARKVVTPAYRQQIAESIAAGVDAYADSLTALKPKPASP